MSARTKAIGATIEDSDRVTITEWRIAPGAETGWHRHGLDYVVVYRTAATVSEILHVAGADFAGPLPPVIVPP